MAKSIDYHDNLIPQFLADVCSVSQGRFLG